MDNVWVVIEEWDGDGVIRIPDQVLQCLKVNIGDSLYILEEYVGTTRNIVLSKTPTIPERIDELIESRDKNRQD